MTDPRVTEILRRYSNAEADRRNHEDAWEDNERLFMPFRGDVTAEREREGQHRVGPLVDGTGMQALDRYSNFVRSNMFPPDGDWVRLDPSMDLMDDQEAHEVMDISAERFALALEESNFYSQAGQLVRDLICFGGGVLLKQEDKPINRGGGNTFGGFVFSSPPIWKTAYLTGVGGRVYQVFFEVRLPAIDAVRWFENPGEVVEMIAEDQPTQEVDYLHTVYAKESDKGSGLGGGSPWNSVWISRSDQDVIEEKGLDFNPYFTPRWQVSEGDTYGQGPGHLARPDAMALNTLTAMLDVSMGRDLLPPTMVESDSMFNMDLGPNGLVVMKNPKAFRPQAYRTESRYDVALQMREDLRQEVRRHFKADFLEQPQTQPRSAEESARLRAMALNTLASPAENLVNEFLRPLVLSGIQAMEKAGALPELTEFAQERGLSSVEIRPRFVSPLFTAQKAAKVQLMRGYLEARFREVEVTQNQGLLDDIDFDELHIYEAQLLDIPARIRKDADELAGDRLQRDAAQGKEIFLNDAERVADIRSKRAQAVGDIQAG